MNLIISETGWNQDYILSLGESRIADLSAHFLKNDAQNKLWELQLTSLGYPPQTNDDAFRLSNKYEEIISALEDQVRLAEGRESKEEYYDGQMRMV